MNVKQKFLAKVVIVCIIGCVIIGCTMEEPNFEPMPVADKDLYTAAIELIGIEDLIVQDNVIFIIPVKDEFSIQTYSLKGTGLKLKINPKPIFDDSQKAAEATHEYDLLLQEAERDMKDDYMQRLRMFSVPEPTIIPDEAEISSECKHEEIILKEVSSRVITEPPVSYDDVRCRYTYACDKCKAEKTLEIGQIWQEVRDESGTLAKIKILEINIPYIIYEITNYIEAHCVPYNCREYDRFFRYPYKLVKALNSKSNIKKPCVYCNDSNNSNGWCHPEKSNCPYRPKCFHLIPNEFIEMS